MTVPVVLPDTLPFMQMFGPLMKHANNDSNKGFHFKPIVIRQTKRKDISNWAKR